MGRFRFESLESLMGRFYTSHLCVKHLSEYKNTMLTWAPVGNYRGLLT